MSDSLNATVIVSVPELMIVANPELEESDEDEPRLPAVVAAAPPVLEELDDEESSSELSELPPETLWPAAMLSSEATVPLTGAYSLVSSSAVSSFLTVSSALSTDARADAIADGEGVVVVVVVVVVVSLELEPVALDEDEPDPVEGCEDPVDGVVVDGVVTVTVTVAVGAVAVGEVVVGEVVVGEVVVGVESVVAVGVADSFRVSDTNSVVDDPRS
jgi:hypothetical protein